MVIVRFLIRLIRLPFDIVFLTVDFFRVGLYTVRWLVSKLAGVDRPPFGPCMQATFEEIDGEEVSRCALSRKYGNPGLVRLLCSGANGDHGETGLYLCACEGSILTNAFRLMLTGLLLLVIWGAVLGGAGYLLLERYGNPFSEGAAAEGDETPGSLVVEDDSRERAGEWVVKGSSAAEQGDVAAARVAYQKASELDPANVSAWIGLGHAAAELDLPGEASEAFSTAVELEPQNVEAMVGASKAARDNGNAQRALEMAARAAEVAPDNLEARLQLVRSQRLSGDVEAAAEGVEDLLAIAGDDPRASLEMAAVALANQQLDEAEKGFRKAVDIDPSLLEARVGLAQVLARRGKDQEAVDHLQALARENPAIATPRIELAELYLRLGNRARAIELFSELAQEFTNRFLLRARYAELLAIDERYDESYIVLSDLLDDNPGDAVAHMVLADLYLRRDLPTLADKHVTKAMAQRPGDVRAYRLKTRILMTKEAYENAIRILRLLLERFPRDVELRLRLAFCLERTGEVEEAVAQLKRVTRIRPEAVAPYIQLAQIYSRDGRFLEAAEQYRIALKRDPENPAVYNNLALALLDGGASAEEPLELAVKARELAPENARIADTYAWCHYLTGNAQAAEEASAQAAVALPDEPIVRYHRGAILAELGRTEEAVRELRLALEASASFPGRDKARQLFDSLARENGD